MAQKEETKKAIFQYAYDAGLISQAYSGEWDYDLFYEFVEGRLEIPWEECDLEDMRDLADMLSGECKRQREKKK